MGFGRSQQEFGSSETDAWIVVSLIWLKNRIGFLPLEAPVTMKVLGNIVWSRNTEWTEKMHIKTEKGWRMSR